MHVRSMFHHRFQQFVIGTIAVLIFLVLAIGWHGTSRDMSAALLAMPNNDVARQGVGFATVDFLDSRSRGNVTNRTLVDRLTGQGGLFWKAIRIARYTLGGIFMIFLGIYALQLVVSRGDDGTVGEFKNALAYAFVGFLIMSLAEPVAFAFDAARSGRGNFITDPELLKIALERGGMSIRAAAHVVQYILGGIALIFMSVAAFKIITAQGDEEQMTTSRKTVVWSFLGLIFAASVGFLVDHALAPTDGGAVLLAVDLGSLAPDEQASKLLEMSRLASRVTVLTYVKYFQTFVAGIAVFMLFLSGAKIIMAGDTEDVVSQQKKTIPLIFVGLFTILIAEVIVNIFFPMSGGLIRTPGADQFATFATQLGGFANFLLTFLGVVAVLAIIVGALYYATAGINEEQAEKGKQILLAAVLGIVVTLSAYALVTTVFSGKISINPSTSTTTALPTSPTVTPSVP